METDGSKCLCVCELTIYAFRVQPSSKEDVLSNTFRLLKQGQML